MSSLPAQGLTAVTAQEPQGHQEGEGGSRPVETGVTVAMVEEAVQPLVLDRCEGTQKDRCSSRLHSQLLDMRHEKSCVCLRVSHSLWTLTWTDKFLCAVLWCSSSRLLSWSRSLTRA